MADVGRLILLVSLGLGAYAAVGSFLAAKRKLPQLWISSRHASWAIAGLMTVAVAALVVALVSHDFAIRYVTEHSNRDMPLFYTVTALWGGQDGSLLFWAWLLSIISGVVLWQHRDDYPELMPYVAATLMTVETFFLIVLNFEANPFDVLGFVPADGQGLNPLLQNPGMVLHPPTLYLGFVGFTVPFAFAIAALLSGRVGAGWIRLTRRWTLFAWLFLSIGILLGANWAYNELGWGGYWAWDPVENSSLMPWLTGTAFLHSVMIQEHRGMLKVWNFVLILLTFTLSLFGTFLTRSGVIDSVHAFALSNIGTYFLAFIAIILLGTLGLLYDRWDILRSDNELDSIISRESAFLVNNIVFVGAAFAVFCGTVYPVASELITGTKIVVGPPFFNRVEGPIFLFVIVLMGVAPLLPWRRASRQHLTRNFLVPFVLSIVVGLGLRLSGMHEWWAVISFAVIFFVAYTVALEYVRGTRAQMKRSGDNPARALFALVDKNHRRYGGYIIHLGVVLMAVGIVGSSFFRVEAEKVLAKGENMAVGNYLLQYDSFAAYPTQNMQVNAATVSVYENGKFLGQVTPEKNLYFSSNQPMTEVAVRTTPKEDLYVILAGWQVGGETVTLKVFLNPLIVWLWIGGAVLILGAIIAMWPDPREERILARIRSRELAWETVR
jgi:cytochrome c-type biogenesis protein CcmF